MSIDAQNPPFLRWLTPAQYNRLSVLQRSSAPIHALIMAIYHCENESDFREIIIQAIIAMSERHADMVTTVSKLRSCQPPPPIILVTTEAEKARIEKEFADRAR